MMNKYTRFKSLLEYYVSHLEYCQNESVDCRGYSKYIEPIKNEFKKSGQGYNNRSIQNQIAQWSSYDDFEICISINAGSIYQYANLGSYLHWRGTSLNIIAEWDINKSTITRLTITDKKSKNKSVSIEELGLFDEQAPNQHIEAFFNDFCELRSSTSLSQSTMDSNGTPANSDCTIKIGDLDIVEHLTSNHNIILHGAPGTGKTYLAKEIARAMCNIAKDKEVEDSDQFEMVQFHPSYDYTDFVEGLRPKSDGKGNIVFERTDGVFKAFCKRAITGETIGSPQITTSVSVSTTGSGTSITSFLKPAWDSLIDDLESNIYDLPNKERGRTVKLQPNKKDKNRIDFYTLDGNINNAHWATLSGILDIHKEFGNPSAIKNVNKDIRKVCKGSQTSTLWAIYNEVYNRALKLADNAQLEPPIKICNNEECPKFVFLIDEINRGDMSKIFGELFFSIDPGYRGKDGRINTQYQNMLEGSDDVFKSGFYIPENVYIIGTMNDIDRSVESMDFAMRRRFQFIEITAEDRAEGMKLYKETEAYKRMTNLNMRIESKEIGLSRAYHIGGSYFLKKHVPINDGNKQEFDDLWQYRLNGLLREYLRGDDDIEKKIQILKKAYDEDWKPKSSTPNSTIKSGESATLDEEEAPHKENTQPSETIIE